MDEEIKTTTPPTSPSTTSPVAPDQVVEPKKLMTFVEAMAEVLSGHSVKREEWGELNEYGILKDGWLMIHKGASNRFDVWKVSSGDMEADDWYVVHTL